MKKIMSLVLLLILCACSYAGPFVSSISSDGDNGLIVEKCNVKFDAFLGIVSNTDCSTTSIKISKN